MDRLLKSRILWGCLLILGGVLFLLQNLGVIEFGGLFWAVLLGLGALFFLTIFFTSRTNWWALIPGMALMGVALVVILGYLSPGISDVWSGFIVLGSIGLSFILIFLVNHQNWWALIPGGALITLGLVSGAAQFLPGIETGGIFLLGLGVTFALVALVPTPQGRMWWAWIPAGILAFIGLILTAVAGNIFIYIGPFVLIVGGGILIYFALKPR
jgi:hypothetical protein